DDDEVREVAIAMLTELGYRVVKARDAAAALVVIDSGIPIDLIFTDVMMPGALRSPELARKAKERLPNIAVLFTSGYTQNAIVHGGRLDPGVELLAKPYTRDVLKGATVLLVEDDELIRATTAEMLSEIGCAAKEAANAEAALEVLDDG